MANMSEMNSVTKQLDMLLDESGRPMIQISCAAAELIPTKQYANITIGPIVVKRWIADIGDDNLKEEIRKTQAICEDAVAEDRQTIHNWIRQSEGGRISE